MDPSRNRDSKNYWEKKNSEHFSQSKIWTSFSDVVLLLRNCGLFLYQNIAFKAHKDMLFHSSSPSIPYTSPESMEHLSSSTNKFVYSWCCICYNATNYVVQIIDGQWSFLALLKLAHNTLRGCFHHNQWNLEIKLDQCPHLYKMDKWQFQSRF